MEAIVFVDRTGTIAYANEGVQELFGYPLDAAVGRTLDLLVPEEFRPRHWSGWTRAWERDAFPEGAMAMIPVLCADGEVRRFAGRLIGVRNAHGRLVAGVGVWSSPSPEDEGLPALA